MDFFKIKYKFKRGLKVVIKSFLPIFFNTDNNNYLLKVPSNLRTQTLTIPEHYNANGRVMEIFYLNDTTFAPYNTVLGRTPSYFFWDRFTYTLPIRFFAHNSLYELQKINKYCDPKKNYYMIFESEGIMSEFIHYDLMDARNLDGYDAIFTPHKCILDKYKNAHFIPGGGVYIGTKEGGGDFVADQYKKKTKIISIVSSFKAKCLLHIRRKQLAEILKNKQLADTFGTFDGGKNIRIADSLTDYMFSVAIENYVSPYYFTEKLLNCFATQTVPIYVGASELSKFFNMAGVIYVKEDDIMNIPDIVSSLTKDDYMKRKDAIIDNYERVKKYMCIEDYIYENYKDIIV